MAVTLAVRLQFSRHMHRSIQLFRFHNYIIMVKCIRQAPFGRLCCCATATGRGPGATSILLYFIDVSL